MQAACLMTSQTSLFRGTAQLRLEMRLNLLVRQQLPWAERRCW